MTVRDHVGCGHEMPRPQVPEGKKKHNKQTKQTPTIQRFEHFRKRFLEDSNSVYAAQLALIRRLPVVSTHP